MIRPAPRYTRSDTLFPSTPLFRSRHGRDVVEFHGDGRVDDRCRIRIGVADGERSQSIADVDEIVVRIARLLLVGIARADGDVRLRPDRVGALCERSEEHTSELQSLMRISYAVFCLKKKTNTTTNKYITAIIMIS